MHFFIVAILLAVISGLSSTNATQFGCGRTLTQGACRGPKEMKMPLKFLSYQAKWIGGPRHLYECMSASFIWCCPPGLSIKHNTVLPDAGCIRATENH
ncbi:hypothetical protein PGT21_029804 [Puccinia graminis f. sp. tritici]|nr:hypothetical protein PGT21_029804 [Puccinia graminis f. sp. tritici]